jgi:hypothetical protein
MSGKISRRVLFAVTTMSLWLFSLPGKAQQYYDYGSEPAYRGQSREFTPTDGLTNVMYSGAAGGILGLSTLSFSNEPMDDLDHVLVGTSLGIIVGVIYTTWDAAQSDSWKRPRSYDSYRDSYGSYMDTESVYLQNSVTSLERRLPSSEHQSSEDSDALSVGWSYKF